MSTDQRARILEAITPVGRGVREMAEELRWAPSHVISLIKKMEDEGLIMEVQSDGARHSKRGRPKKKMACTPLGLDFIKTHRRLMTKPLRAGKEDLEHAVEDALYAKRLIENGHSPFDLFMELNAIARNIKISSETSQST
ncbi:hypothetical protein GTO27_03515 [Candidatus Bathyarchaeota archaeon]|nr:hypothetical protein [Candidatus Bathyarchaeota archaeon]